MGALYEAVKRVERVIEERGLDAVRIKGQIGMKAGFFLVTIREDTEDDPESLVRLKEAAREVLGEPI